MCNKNKNKVSFFKIIWYEFKFAFKHSPILMMVELLALFIHALSFVAVTLSSQLFFDSITKSDIQYAQVLSYALMMVGCFIFNQIINGFENTLNNILYEKLLGKSNQILFQKAAEIGYEHYESAAFNDDFEKAKQGANFFHIPLFPMCGLVTLHLTYFLSVGIYLYSLRPILVISLIILFLPNIIIKFFIAKKYKKLEDDTVSDKRRNQYFESCLCSENLVRETRTLFAVAFFKKLYTDTLNVLMTKSWDTAKKVNRLKLLETALLFISYLIVLILLISSTLDGYVTLGAFTAVYMSIDRMLLIITGALGILGNAIQNIGLFKNYLGFLENIEDKYRSKSVLNLDSASDTVIGLNNVSYKYQNADCNALENITLSIHQGEKIGIVGENGSGKTTLTRIMMGLYTPTEGECRYHLGDSKNEEPLFSTSAVFQNFQRYHMTIRENVALSNINQLYDDSLIIYTLDQVGISLEHMKNGIDTVLAKEFEGIDISGGQWQRVAIGRGTFKPHKLLFMDEPTSAIDPLEENKIYHIIRKMMGCHTTILVTHRLGIVKALDRIFVLEKGRIIEEGNHDMLMEKDGYYKKMYHEQSKWYI